MAVENGKIASGELRDTDKVVVDSFAALSPNDFDDTPTAGSKKLMTSGAIKEALEQASEPSDYAQVKAQVQQNTQDIAGIEDKIPAQASAQNQLADKAFVNSSIATNTATFRGTYNLVSDLGLTVSATHDEVAAEIATKLAALVPPVVPENNDYCFVQVPRETSDPTVIDRIDRYKCSVTESGGETTRVWDYEWSLNNSSFTADQWAAINSGITAGLVEKLNGIEAGAQVNAIQTVKVNGSALTPDASKAVDVTVPVKATTTPVIAGNAAIGDSSKFAAENHVHPAETEVVAYRLPDDCFPITYEDSTLPSGQQSCTIASNDGIRFEFFSAYNIVILHDIASEAAGGYDFGFSHFSASTLKWSSNDAPIDGLKFNNTAPTANTWPVLEKDAVFVRDVQVAKEADVKTALAGKLGNTGDQTLSGSLIIDRDGPDGDAWMQTKRGNQNGLAIALSGFTIDGHFQALPYASGVLALLSDIYAVVQQIAPGFTAKEYVLNELCTYNGVVYRCKWGYTATASSLKPDSDTTHWEAKKVSELLTLLAPLASPAFSGRPTAPNMDEQSTDGQVANKKYVDEQVAGATPSDYNAVKAQVAANAQKLEVWLSVNPQTGVVSANYDDGQSAE